ncbi:nitrogenase iron-molybdenum cofactor biosynthesis protein NifN [Vibrio sp. MA40-2]|uniref:nitrogenase iron-molybdenum cofactor biosynthesis protein NifN n=1 Tax=Vibrio sp. MA40-2 TaxID=3391828 RepID=UPI0039A75D10
MTKIIKANSPLSTQPLKTSQATGATLASLGFQNTIPLLHGSQGCGAFSKVYLIQHLREPIPLQNTAIDQISAVMGGDENLYEALRLLCEKDQPDLITVMTTGLTEMQGCDTFRIIMNFRKDFPKYNRTRIVNMSTPDFLGSMQSGFALTVDSIIRQLVKPKTSIVRQRKQVNVLCSVAMTSSDIDTLKRYLDAFDIDAIFAPDLSLSLDGHLDANDYSTSSTGGTSVLEVEMMANSVATIVFGESLLSTAKWLEKRFDIPWFYSELGMGITSMDELVMYLSQLTNKSVPEWMNRARKRLQDAMLDTHFLLTNASIGLGLEPDLAIGYLNLLNSVGANIVNVVTTVDSAKLAEIANQTDVKRVVIGDLSMLTIEPEPLSLVVSNTHAAHICEPDIPVLRAGYPCHDQFGNMDVGQFGYEGSRERLFALANLLLRNHVNEVSPHLSVYRFEPSETRPEVKI